MLINVYYVFFAESLMPMPIESKKKKKKSYKLSKNFVWNGEIILHSYPVFRIPERVSCYHFYIWDTKLGQTPIILREALSMK